MNSLTVVRGGKLRRMAGTKDSDNHFVEWLLDQLKGRGWTREELARRADVRSPAITQVVNRNKNLGPKLARKIASALDVDPAILFRIAGLLPESRAQDDEEWQQVEFWYGKLTNNDDRRRAVELIRALVKANTRPNIRGRSAKGKKGRGVNGAN